MKKKLGRGAFGVVWLAEKQTMAGSFEFALKLAAREDIDLKALQEEVATWKAASGHPNVLPLIEADIHEDDYVIVSEYAPDGSLEKWIDDNGGRAPTVDAAVEMIIGILNGLEHLHSRNIIHRDLKPANILLQGHTPRLADFGVARVLKSTQSTTIRGTVPYMSPDALQGKRTVETDIWSVGVVFYRLLTGEMPYPQKEQVELMYSILNNEAQPLPYTIPQYLREIIERALNKNSDARYQSAREMREAVYAAKHAKYKPTIEYGKTTSQAKLEDETMMFDTTSEETVLQTAVDNEKIITQRPAPLLDTIAAPAPQPVQTTNDIAVKTLPRKNKRVWWAVGGIGAITVLTVLITVVVLVLVTPKIFKHNGNAHTANLPNGVKLEMVLIPSGSFMMGSSEAEVQEAYQDAKRYLSANLDWFNMEKPKHSVSISYSFYMGKFEVTQAQWQALMGNNPSNFKNCDNCPVEEISWYDAQEFIKKLNALNDGYIYRLPTEAEWEYACRAGTTTAFSFGDSLSSTQANFNGSPYGDALKGPDKGRTMPVGSYQPNVFGLFDMHGNVYEWVEDIYQDNYNGLPVDGSANKSKGDSSKRVQRGCSWLGYGVCLRSAARGRADTWRRDSTYGFRVVAVPKT